MSVISPAHIICCDDGSNILSILSSPAVDSSSSTFVLGTLACTYQNYSATMHLYIQLVTVLGRGISPVARHTPTQYNTNTDESWAIIYALSGIRTLDPSV
jgi:hypothetical protein